MTAIIICLVTICFNIQVVDENKYSFQATDTTITGTAKNAKWGAVVVTKKSGTFYIDGKDSWSDKELNKTVEVSGKLKIQTFTEKDIKDEEGNYSQGMIGDKKTIYKAKIKLK